MNIPLKLYYHIYCINHFMQIVREQIECIVNSGLYDELEGIYVGVLGEDEPLNQLKQYFEQYPKVKIVYHSYNPKEYEFATLKILKRSCDESPEKFYGFYIFNKAVSYPESHEAYYGGVFWRRHMMEWVIKRWRQNYKAIDLKYMGYDLAGCKVVPARVSPNHHTHISGNMFMFNSEYIKSLTPIDNLNTNDRFAAEVWHATGQPLIYVACNLFVDYIVPHRDYDEFMRNYKDLPDFCL